MNYASQIQTFLLTERIIEETDDCTIRLDVEGVTRRDLKAGHGWIPRRLHHTLV